MTSGAHRRTADFRVSTTDADATPMPCGDGGTRLGDQDHYVVDGGRARIILAALVAPAEVQEIHPALDLLWRVRFRWKLRPWQVTGDTKYGAFENIVAIEGQGIRADVPMSEVGHRSGLFRNADFVYGAAADASRCSAGQTLRFLTLCHTTRRRIDAAPAAAWVGCALRPQCPTARRGRRGGRSLDAAYLERVRGYHDTEGYANQVGRAGCTASPLHSPFSTRWDSNGVLIFDPQFLTRL